MSIIIQTRNFIVISPKNSDNNLGIRICEKSFGNLITKGEYLDISHIYIETFDLDGETKSSISINIENLNEFINTTRRFCPKIEKKKKEKKVISVTRVG